MSDINPANWISDNSWATQGYEVGDAASLEKIGYSTVLTGGVGDYLPPTPPAPNQTEVISPSYNFTPSLQRVLSSVGEQYASTGLYDASGVRVTNALGQGVDIGGGQTLHFDPDTLAARVQPTLLPHSSDWDYVAGPGGMYTTFTGSDLRVLIEIPDPPKVGDAKPRYYKQLVECTTLSVSIHREKAPVRAAGYINPKGFARGKRTIAGTLILTQFSTDVLAEFLQSVLVTDTSKDTTYVKVDQLPAFNMTLLFINEMGYASYRRLLGIEFVTDGTVYSVQDMLTEQTISFMASDFTHLLPLNLDSLFKPSHLGDRTTTHERNVSEVIHNYFFTTQGTTSS